MNYLLLLRLIKINGSLPLPLSLSRCAHIKCPDMLAVRVLSLFRFCSSSSSTSFCPLNILCDHLPLYINWFSLFFIQCIFFVCVSVSDLNGSTLYSIRLFARDHSTSSHTLSLSHCLAHASSFQPYQFILVEFLLYSNSRTIQSEWQKSNENCERISVSVQCIHIRNIYPIWNWKTQHQI